MMILSHLEELSLGYAYHATIIDVAHDRGSLCICSCAVSILAQCARLVGAGIYGCAIIAVILQPGIL